jgi:hypothetical protein
MGALTDDPLRFLARRPGGAGFTAGQLSIAEKHQHLVPRPFPEASISQLHSSRARQSTRTTLMSGPWRAGRLGLNYLPARDSGDEFPCPTASREVWLGPRRAGRLVANPLPARDLSLLPQDSGARPPTVVGLWNRWSRPLVGEVQAFNLAVTAPIVIASPSAAVPTYLTSRISECVRLPEDAAAIFPQQAARAPQ